MWKSARADVQMCARENLGDDASPPKKPPKKRKKGAMIWQRKRKGKRRLSCFFEPADDRLVVVFVREPSNSAAVLRVGGSARRAFARRRRRRTSAAGRASHRRRFFASGATRPRRPFLRDRLQSPEAALRAARRRAEKVGVDERGIVGSRKVLNLVGARDLDRRGVLGALEDGEQDRSRRAPETVDLCVQLCQRPVAWELSQKGFLTLSWRMKDEMTVCRKNFSRTCNRWGFECATRRYWPVLSQRTHGSYSLCSSKKQSLLMKGCLLAGVCIGQGSVRRGRVSEKRTVICSFSSGLEGGDESDGGVGSCAAWSGPESPTAIEPGDMTTGIGSSFGRDEDKGGGGGGDALRERFALGPSYETSSSMSQSPCLTVGGGGGGAAPDEAAADEADPVANGLLPAAADCVDQYGGTST